MLSVGLSLKECIQIEATWVDLVKAFIEDISRERERSHKIAAVTKVVKVVADYFSLLYTALTLYQWLFPCTV